jgi:zinc/manganese transport system substrate-binding protein
VRHANFARRWHAAIGQWQARASPLKGVRAVAHHQNWTYLYDWLGIVSAGTLEPKPGLPPSAAHLAGLKQTLARQPARMVLRTPYEDARPAEWLARETGARPVLLPFTVGGTPEASDLFSLFDEILARLLAGAT